MGGFATIIKDAGKEAFESKPVQNFFVSAMTEFGRTEIGKSSYNLLKKYNMTRDQLQYGIMKGNPQIPLSEARTQASNASRKITFGTNDALLVAHIKAASDPRFGGSQHYAMNLADRISAHFKEDDPHWERQAYPQSAYLKPGQQGPVHKASYNVTEHQSEFKWNIKKSKDNTLDIDTSRVYQKPSEFESRLLDYFHAHIAPFIAIPHLATNANMLFAPSGSMIRGLAFALQKEGNRNRDIQNFLERSGTLTESVARGKRALEDARNGIISQHLPGSFQHILSKVSSVPGFSSVRDFSTSFAGATAYHTAIDFAGRLAKNTADKRAIAEFKELGFDNNDLMQIIKHGGQLTQEQMERAVYFGTNNKIFFSTDMDRAMMSTSNPWMRLSTMYHGYVSAQGHLFKREFQKAWNSGDKLGVAKFMLVAGVAFPMVGELVKNGEMIGRGQWAQVPNSLKHDLEDATFQHVGKHGEDTTWEHLKGFGEVYLDALAHTAAFGVVASYVESISRNMLVSAMGGPIIGMVGKTAQDAFNAVAHYDTPGSEKPITRDALQLMLRWNIGKIISHAALPTKKEQKLAKGPSHKLRGLKGMKGLKNLKSTLD